MIKLYYIRMRSRYMLFCFLAIFSLSILFIIFQDSLSRPAIETLVTETHKQIKNLKTFKENIKIAEQKELVVNNEYLYSLGFVSNAPLYQIKPMNNSTLPFIVTYVMDNEHGQVVGLARCVNKYLPNHLIFIYNLGVPEYQLGLMKQFCNNSTKCVIVEFSLSKFPSHVRSSHIKAYRPLVLQDALNRVGAVLFLDPDVRIISSDIEKLFTKYQNKSVIGWETRIATTTITHPKMFDYFHTPAENFFFLPIIQVDKLIVYNTEDTHQAVMLPWIQCALISECISPIGVQTKGCRYDKKPQYRYSGCHGFDVSAFNIVLGIHYQFDSTSYVIHEKPELFFTKVTARDAQQNLQSLILNITDSPAVT
ncbi:uncharacterized protein LOC126895279 [Daktulosphaira vitifoliae]|uniref:uncharacterized protein LOC126895279 n=1 Tax=Daktulosphaira vitifoliae TaxID=58002 RepID=UPI0021A9F650|nr:uncharacterized protein LOC126895279 [Daktulosphaira vitifoliae]